MDGEKEKMTRAKRMMLQRAASLMARDKQVIGQDSTTEQNPDTSNVERSLLLTDNTAQNKRHSPQSDQDVEVQVSASQVDVAISSTQDSSEGKVRLSPAAQSHQGNMSAYSDPSMPPETLETKVDKPVTRKTPDQQRGRGTAPQRGTPGNAKGAEERVANGRRGRGNQGGQNRDQIRRGRNSYAKQPAGNPPEMMSWEVVERDPELEWRDAPNRPDLQPLEWRRGNVTEKEDNTRALDQLIALNKEMDLTEKRFENGGAGARVGMSRLQGKEKNEWAFLDESDVSTFEDQIQEPAMTFQFELDDFQKRAILQVEKQNSVFVAAHTSAGKTVIAEYAIALAAMNGHKAFYTSPIKTLSNQKLRDFREKFSDVGLVTGDVSIDDDAQCVIMTTEILRSMLYRGADVIRNVSCVIFDEVQFLNDEERGVVWEESIIMLPPHVLIIMLSATVPNALEFASWVGKTKNRKVAVVSTLKRPVPLKHSILYRQRGTQDEIQETVLLEQGGPFLSENYRKALMAITGSEKSETKKTNQQSSAEQETNDASSPEEKTTTTSFALKPMTKGVNRNKGSSSKSDAAAAFKVSIRGPNTKRSPWAPLVTFLYEKNCTPSVIFCFSKKKCEKAVDSLENKDFLPDTGQKAYVHKFFEDSIERLREEDRGLPQILRVRNHLKRGIAAHHAGLLPLAKEITEILFSRGYVKVLFATETFAMGVNMPARTVVFAGLRKHDGRRFRNLEAGEYTQMSGRAGRRGHDKVGNVYLFFPPDERIPDEGSMARIMTGRPISLRSAFRLTYNMILNVLRVDELRVEEVMKKSFSEAWGSTMEKGITAVLDKAGETLSRLKIDDLSSNPPSSSTSEEGSHANEPTVAKNVLPMYASKFSSLIDASSELTYREINPIFRDTVRPGRAIIAEVTPGSLSLCVVYSIVPPPSRKSKGRPKVPSESQLVVRHDTLLWVAAISGVRPSAMRRHISSVLLLPETQLKYTDNHINPRVVSSDGLVVVLEMVAASKVVYVCDECQELSHAVVDAQANASRHWHFSKSSSLAKRTLPLNVAFLQNVVAKWRRNNGKGRDASNMERFIEEIAVMQPTGSNMGDMDGSNIVPDRKQKRRFVAQLPEAYTRRVNICLQLITDSKLAKCVIDGGGKDLLSDAARLILAKNVKDKMLSLKKIHEAGSQPHLLPEYHQRVEVLQALGYIGSDGLSVQLKGRCACEVATVDAVVLTEVIVENVLENLEPAEVASLLSSLVCRKKNVSTIHDGDEEWYSQAYRDAKREMRNVVEKFGLSQEAAGVELEFEIGDGLDYEGSICRWELAYAIYEWARGGAFFTITDLTVQQEGDIVVCVKRLIELLRDAQAVAKIIGNMELLDVLEDAVECVRRDVIFNGSLYYDKPATREVLSESDGGHHEGSDGGHHEGSV